MNELKPLPHMGLAGRIAGTFSDSKLTPLMILASILLGIGAVELLPREEEPQIVVPMIDVMVQMPGASAKEIEQRVTDPMEKLLWEIPGVEYIYSTSKPGQALAIVRFVVGENEEAAIVRLNQKMFANFDLIPPGCSRPLIKPRSIDDVPILALTLSSDRYDHYQLRRVAAQLTDPIAQVPGVSVVKLIGGQRRQVRVILDESELAAYHVAPAALVPILQQANRQLQTGGFASANREFLVETGGFFQDAQDVGRVVLGVANNRPIYLSDVARIVDGPEEPDDYVFFSSGPAALFTPGLNGPGVVAKGLAQPAVTISVAKRKGQNAIVIAEEVIAKVRQARGHILPEDVQVAITRNYGRTAEDKSNELLFHMLLAIISVVILIALTLGIRESGIVAIAIPVTLALTLLVIYLYGYTINRVTMFALIFSIGILVDDAIVVVENIVRHYRLPENRGRPAAQVAIEAVNEVGNPTILATFTVIAAILPMAFVRGLMGPYMRPIPVGASAAMVFSLLVAFIVTPWAALRLLKKPCEGPSNPSQGSIPHREDWTARLYRRAMKPLMARRGWRWAFFALVLALFLGAGSLVLLKQVVLKMLPFDNKSEFQIIIDTREGTTLEQTAAVTRQIGDYLRTVPEVADYEMYVGVASPCNFNGLVRHYYLRRGPNVADIQVNLAPKGERSAQSHDIAKRVRPEIDRIVRPSGARIKIAEIPPGPPVLDTLVAEVYGPDQARQIALARKIKNIFSKTSGVVDVDWYVEADQPVERFVVDREKAALNGVSPEQIAETLQMAVEGTDVGLLHAPREKEDVDVRLRLQRAERSSVLGLRQIQVQGSQGLVPLGELARVEPRTEDKSIYHKNLLPVTYVIGDVAGREESPVYAILKMTGPISRLRSPEGGAIAQYFTRQPSSTQSPAIKWDGEWQITYEVFRDMGLAFAVVLILIYILVVGWFQSLVTPLVIMAVIPLSLVGILPAHWLMGAFFTATSMIGFIAGAGIVVRNSIILVDFIELRLKQGMPLAEAAVDAGAVRFRPIMLTAAAVVVGASVILFDPIFQGLALSLMAGEIVSLFLAPAIVPILYYLSRRKALEKRLS